MAGLIRRLNSFGIEHPWQFAAVSFASLALLSGIILLVFHRNFFGGLFAASGAVIGTAAGTVARRRGSSTPFYLKAVLAMVFVVAFFLLWYMLAAFSLVPK